MSKDLLSEAIAEAKTVKEIAIENAKAALTEAFQPRIQRVISSRIAEEEGYEDEDMDLGFEEPLPEPAVEEEPEEEFMESEYIDDGKAGTPAARRSANADEINEDELDEEFNSIIKELEDGLNEMEDDEEYMEEGDGREPYSEPERNDGPIVVEGDDDINVEALINKLEEEEGWDEEPPKDEKNDGPVKVESLRKENRELKKKLTEAYKVVAKQKSAMNEVNLLNSKLMYSFKIMNNSKYRLSEADRVDLLEMFDRAKNRRECKLVYVNAKRLYDKQFTAEKIRKPNYVKENASRSIQAIKQSSKTRLSESAKRMQQLAGIIPLDE